VIPVPKHCQCYHQIGAHEYFYDIWSNIHYGYVGTACGFTESELLDGAGLEQIGSTLARGRMPDPFTSDARLRRWDDASDQASIALGIALYGQPNLTAELIRQRVLATPGLTRRPAQVHSPLCGC